MSSTFGGESAAGQPVGESVEGVTGLSGRSRGFLQIVIKERAFLALLIVLFLAAGASYRTPSLAMWVGFLVAGYSVVANDSIQTIGTFIASNKGRPWWLLWLFIGGIFVVTVTYSWLTHHGDVSFERLAAKGFDQAPTSFTYLQVAAPIFLLILTRLRMPVSTTFLLLTAFATESGGVSGVLVKSLAGYGVAFATAIAAWLLLARPLQRWIKGAVHPGWIAAQWLTTGALWSVWIMQDAANVAVFLPRSLTVGQLILFAGAIFLGLGILFRMGGEKVQEVVDEKSQVSDVRAATVIDAVYLVILYLFKVQSNVPMSTTWVFLGLLAGREVAMTIRGTGDRKMKEVGRLIGRDVGLASIGLLVSFILAVLVNDALRADIAAMLGL